MIHVEAKSIKIPILRIMFRVASNESNAHKVKIIFEDVSKNAIYGSF